MKVSAIARVYGSLIIKRRKTIDEVPKNLQEQVKQYLEDEGYGKAGDAE